MLNFLVVVLYISFAIPAAGAIAVEPDKESEPTNSVSESTSDLTEEITKFKLFSKKSKNLLIVPIPVSNPTFGTGLILGGAYFYNQSEQKKESQPASFTGAAMGYTDEESWFAGVMQQNYWDEDNWRFTGVASYVDLELQLNTGLTADGENRSVAWLVDGGFLQARIARRLWGYWYLGLTGRYLDITQSIGRNMELANFDFQSKVSAIGIGLNLDFDTRDMPYNPYSGSYLEVKAMSSDQSGSDTESYQSYQARFRSYHSLADPLVLAWDINACSKSGQIPLWDSCKLALRGFSSTDYLSRQSLSAQAEIRWRIYRRWGMVAFAGAGRVSDSFGKQGEGETIPSYGVGVRFMVLESQRINLRLDYARSVNGNDALYLSVTEAF